MTKRKKIIFLALGAFTAIATSAINLAVRSNKNAININKKPLYIKELGRVEWYYQNRVRISGDGEPRKWAPDFKLSHMEKDKNIIIKSQEQLDALIKRNPIIEDNYHFLDDEGVLNTNFVNFKNLAKIDFTKENLIFLSLISGVSWIESKKYIPSVEDLVFDASKRELIFKTTNYSPYVVDSAWLSFFDCFVFKVDKAKLDALGKDLDVIIENDKLVIV